MSGRLAERNATSLKPDAVEVWTYEPKTGCTERLRVAGVVANPKKKKKMREEQEKIIECGDYRDQECGIGAV